MVVILKFADSMDQRLDNFLEPVAPNQEPFYDEFESPHLRVWPDRNSWRPCQWKTNQSWQDRDIDIDSYKDKRQGEIFTKEDWG